MISLRVSTMFSWNCSAVCKESKVRYAQMEYEKKSEATKKLFPSSPVLIYSF